jgi:hypothetical protein
MATPTVPASQSAAVKAAEVRAMSAEEIGYLNSFVKVLMARREAWSDELMKVIDATTKRRIELGKLGQDTFVELADLSKDYYKTVSSGAVQPVDALKYIIELYKLEQKNNLAMGNKDEELLRRADQNALLAGPPGSPEYLKVKAETVATALNAGLTSPDLVGTWDQLTAEVNKVDPSILTTNPAAAEVQRKYEDRKAASASLTARTSELRRQLGDAAKIQALLSGGNQQQIQQAADAVAPTLTQASQWASKFPGKSDITTGLEGEEARIAELRRKLEEDPMVALEEYRKTLTRAPKEERDIDFYKTIASTKFQRWAASNNLMVGKMRPATSEKDKQQVGYIAELNAVYEPGADDQRALVVAHNQSQMRPGSQLFTRRGLEDRRLMEVSIGTKPTTTEQEVTVDAAGNVVTPEDIRAKNQFVGRTKVNGETVFVRADGSGRSANQEWSAKDLEGHGAIDLSEDEAKRVSEGISAAEVKALKTEKRQVAGEPTGVQTLRGRETAMLPTDPADTLYVIETTDGRRVPIRESQLVKESEISKGAPKGETAVAEEPRMGLRKPLAMWRARKAREEAAAPAAAEGEEGPVGPLGRATEVGKQLMSTAEVKALPGTKVVELPARPGGVAAGTGAAVPFTREKPVPPKTYWAETMTEERKTELEPTEKWADLVKPTSAAGRDVRKATGAEQTGAAAATVGAVIPPIATGTPKSAPTYEVEQGTTKYTVDATPLFTPAELAAMNAPETAAQRKARVMRELRTKLGETPAIAPMP